MPLWRGRDGLVVVWEGSSRSRDGALDVLLASFPPAVREYRFAPPRRWRFDIAWPDRRVALELEGGVWIRGRHVRGVGFERDVEKYNEAAARGWCVLRLTWSMLDREFPRCCAWVASALERMTASRS